MSKRNRNRRRKSNHELDRLISGALAGTPVEPVAPTAPMAPEPDTPAKPEKPGTRKPPEDWTAADRKAFAQLPADAQAWVLAREAAMRQSLAEDTRQLAEQRRRHQALVEAAGELEAIGVEPGQYLRTMLEVDRALLNAPEEMIGLLADRFLPVQPAQPVQPVQVVPPVPPVQPMPAAPGDDVHQVIDGMAALADEAGQPAFPHADRLRPAMTGLLESGLAHDLQAAYRMAARLDDELLQADLDSRLAAARAEDDAERQKAVERARRVKPRRTVPAGATRPTDLDGVIAQALNGVGL